MAPTIALPSKWSDFLHVDNNKMELFKFLPQQVLKLPMDEGKCTYATEENNVVCSVADPDLSGLAPCSHEEADSQLFLHVSSAVRKVFGQWTLMW